MEEEGERIVLRVVARTCKVFKYGSAVQCSKALARTSVQWIGELHWRLNHIEGRSS